MDLPFPLVHDFEGVQRNFEAVRDLGFDAGIGAPTTPPQNNAVTLYFRRDTPAVANQRLYIYTGSAWVALTV